jgi:hypothetical protein
VRGLPAGGDQPGSEGPDTGLGVEHEAKTARKLGLHMTVPFRVGVGGQLEPQAPVELDRLPKVGDDHADGIEPCDGRIMTAVPRALPAARKKADDGARTRDPWLGKSLKGSRRSGRFH